MSPTAKTRRQGEPNRESCAKRLHAKHGPRGPPRIGAWHEGTSDADRASRVFVSALILAQIRPHNEGAELGGPTVTNKVTGGP